MTNRVLISLGVALLFSWGDAALAWWGRYGSKYEADNAQREWVSRGGHYTIITYHENRQRTNELKESLIRPWTYPPGDSDPTWTPYLKDCWDKLVMNGGPMVCIGNLSSAGKPWPGLFGEERYKWKTYKTKSEVQKNIRKCWHEMETKQFVCEQKKGVKAGKTYERGSVPKFGHTIKYFRY